jgi:hypothetical protein
MVSSWHGGFLATQRGSLIVFAVAVIYCVALPISAVLQDAPDAHYVRLQTPKYASMIESKTNTQTP